MAEETELKTRLKIENFSFSYADRKILKGLSLEINKGEVVAVVGKSGSGKTTLLKCIATLNQINDGNAYLDSQQYIENGEILFEPWEIRQKIIIVFQDYNLFPNLTVLNNISIGLVNVLGLSKEMAKLSALEIINSLNLFSVKDKYPNEISGGEAQRVALARALVMEPKILLLDEITAAIDPSTILNVINILDKLKENENTRETSVVLVTHNIRFAIDYADKIAFINNGEILEILDAKKFTTKAENEETKKFIHDSKYFI